MPSPFPGMDPFTERQRWEGFHARMITALSDQLVPSVRPTYSCDIEKYVFVVADQEEIRKYLAPDVHIAAENPSFGITGDSQIATLAPAVLTHLEPLEFEQPFLVLRTTDEREVVAVIELLSPWNKSNTEGKAEYLAKRCTFLHSSVSLIEIDLLRGGSRLGCREPLPKGDYYTYLTRRGGRPHVEVYSWMLPDRLPTIPIPLLPEDGEVQLDLQTAFDVVYDSAGYDYVLKYDAPLSPRLSDGEREWVDGQVAAWRSAQSSSSTETM